MDSIQHLLKIACDDSEDTRFRKNYSGRCMYGRTCIGIVGSRNTVNDLIAEVIGELARSNFDDALDANTEQERSAAYTNHRATLDVINTLLTKQQSDSMGFDVIIYWPTLEWQEEPAKEEGEEDEDV